MPNRGGDGAACVPQLTVQQLFVLWMFGIIFGIRDGLEQRYSHAPVGAMHLSEVAMVVDAHHQDSQQDECFAGGSYQTSMAQLLLKFNRDSL